MSDSDNVLDRVCRHLVRATRYCDHGELITASRILSCAGKQTAALALLNVTRRRAELWKHFDKTEWVAAEEAAIAVERGQARKVATVEVAK
jgi:hypothetical protein